MSQLADHVRMVNDSPIKVGMTVRFAVPAPGHEKERFAVQGIVEALWSDGSPTGSVKAVIANTSRGIFVAGIVDPVEADL